jgi:hypothetical protein
MTIDKREATTWRVRRGAYYAALWALGIAIAFYFGPNVILFGKLTRLAPADFIEHVQKYCLPAAVAVKEFQRDHGRLPADLRETVPQYLPEVNGLVMMDRDELWCLAQFNQVITYSFIPGSEGWSVRGPFTRGRIPLPIVEIPATRPSTQVSEMSK